MVRHCGCPPGCDHPWALGRAHVLSSPDIHCANTMALSVLVVMVLAGMVTSNGDAGAAKVFVGSSRAPPKLPSTWGCVPTPIVSEPRSTTIHIWYVTAVDPKLNVGLAVHVPLNMVLNAFWDGLVPNPLLDHHVCPPDTVFVMLTLEDVMALTNTRITSFACMPEGGVIVALVAVVIASSVAGIRDSPTMVIGRPPAAAARNAGIAGPPPL